MPRIDAKNRCQERIDAKRSRDSFGVAATVFGEVGV